MKGPKVFAMGHISVDVIIRRNIVKKLKVGGCIETDDLSLSTGGDVANVSYWIGILGHQIEFIGVVGKDEAANLLKVDLEEAGVKLHLKTTEKNPSSIILIMVEEDGERSHIINGKSQEELEWEDLPLEEIEKSTLFYTSGYTIEKPPVKNTVKKLFKHLNGLQERPKIMFNFAAYTTVERELEEIKNSILPYIDILVGNSEEFFTLMNKRKINGIEEWKEITQELLQKYENIETILVTMGKKGCYYRTKKESGHVEAPEVKVIDTTGAGDGFCAGFIANYVAENPIHECVQKGVKLGSTICEGYGARYGGIKLARKITRY